MIMVTIGMFPWIYNTSVMIVTQDHFYRIKATEHHAACTMQNRICHISKHTFVPRMFLSSLLK